MTDPVEPAEAPQSTAEPAPPEGPAGPGELATASAELAPAAESAAPPAPASPPSVAAIVRSALDALVAAGSELRVLSSAVVLFGAAVVGVPIGSLFLYVGLLDRGTVTVEELPAEIALAILVAGVVGVVALLILLVQIPLLIIAAVGGRLAGLPLTLRQSLRRARQVFLRGVGATFLVGLATGIPAVLAQELLMAVLGPTQLALGLTLLAGGAFGAPWVYVLPGIVLGGVDTGEAMRRSWRLARFRWRLALTIALLAVVGQFIVLAAAEAMLGILVTLGGFAGQGLDVPPSAGPVVVLVILVVGGILGASIVFGIQLVQFAPQASGFYALTHYAAGLDAAREGSPEPLFHRPALLFYGAGVVAGLILLANALGQLPG